MQCDYHHRLLHEGALGIVKEEDRALRFVTADGRTIARNGYRLEDFVDDGIGCVDVLGADASRDAFSYTPAQREEERAEVRQSTAAYHLSSSSTA